MTIRPVSRTVGGWVAGALGFLAAAVALIAWRIWSVAGVLPEGAGGAANQLRLAALWLVTLFVVFALVWTLITLHLTRVFLDPLYDVTLKVRAMGGGAFAERAPVAGPREIRDLAMAVNAAGTALTLREQQILHAERLSAVGTLVVGIAHEINNPLTFLRINEQVLLEQARRRLEAEPERKQENAAAVHMHERNLEGLARIGRVTSTLRASGRAARGRELHDVNVLVDGAYIMAHHRFFNRCDVRRELHARRPVVCEPGEIGQVLLNLLLNAADATPEGGKVSIETADEEGGVRIVVADSGPGITPAFEARLFQAFATTKRDGTGLGLSVSQRIVESHGGTIRYARSELGGAAFTVHLPAAQAAPAPLPEALR